MSDYLDRPRSRDLRPMRSSTVPSSCDLAPPSTLPSPHVLSHPSSSLPITSLQQRLALRNMWELASVLNFLNVFRSVLNLNLDFTMDELETALLTPNALLDNLHIALLKSIHPVNRAHMNRESWVTGLCKKMNEWWRWIADGQFPLVLHHGEENVMYKNLSPDARVIILKALCELRLDQDDIRAYIDEMLRKGNSLPILRKEKIGEDTRGTVYWYENDPLAGQRLYKEPLISGKREKHKSRSSIVSSPTTQWETLATNLEEFEAVVESLCSSRDIFDVVIGRNINRNIIPEIAELRKKRERALKRQHRQALLLDSHINFDGSATGRSRRERKPVTYTFDDFDKSINEAIKLGNIRQQDSLELIMNQDSEVSNASDKQKFDNSDVVYSGEQLNHIHSEQADDQGQDCRRSGHAVVDEETVETIEENKQKGFDAQIVKKKRQLMPGAGEDSSSNHYNEENGCYRSASEVIKRAKESNEHEACHRGSDQSGSCIQGSKTDHDRVEAFDNGIGETDASEAFSASIKDDCEVGLVDLNLVAVGNGIQNTCSRGQKDSSCYIVKVQKVG